MNQLEKMAGQMRRQLEPVQCGWVHRVLFGGLHIGLERKEDTWRLAIARTDVSPSAIEAETVAKAFHLVDAQWSWTQKHHQKTKRNRQGAAVSTRKITYRVAECTWIERQPAPDA